MRFSTRNAFYLRASNYRVLPLFLYLDERHVDWMSDNVLQLVIAEIQPKISQILQESRIGAGGTSSGPSAKKHKVYVERGEGYQFCYFLRNTTRTEVVLLKQKTFSLRLPSPPPPAFTAAREPKRRATTRPSRTRSKSASVQRDEAEYEEDEEIQVKEEPDADFGRDDEEEERNIKDFKPDIDVSYKGFGTSSVQLVLIIEPYPPLPPSEYAPPSSRLSSRSVSIAASRSRSRQTSALGGGRSTRFSSMSQSLAPGGEKQRAESVHAPNMRNATRSISAAPSSRRGGASVTPFRDVSVTPGPGGEGGGGYRGRTPLFIPRDTPFGEDDEDEDAHEEYMSALREGRLRLPSVSRPAGPELDPPPARGKKGKRRLASTGFDYDDDIPDLPEPLQVMSERLIRSSEIEEGVVRVQGGWEERTEGEESAVMGREEPGD